MVSWHTALERELIRRFGGTPKRQPGVDGEIDGRPVEVRAAREDERFRLGKEVHRELVREDGSYIFHDDERGTRRVPADEVSDIMGRGKWYEDRGYPHRFVTEEEIYGPEPEPLLDDRDADPFDLDLSLDL